MIDKESELVEIFNTHYINIVEKTWVVPPENERHPSILKIKNNCFSSITFDFPKAQAADVKKSIP